MKKLIVVVVLFMCFSVGVNGVTVTVRSGATLWEIAQDFNMDVSKLMSMNELQDDKIYPGQKIQVKSYDTAVVSWYGKKYHGKMMANNKEKFDMNNPKLAAHKWLPFGTKVKLTRIDSSKSVVVTIKDRGPYVKGRNFDISKAAAKKLGMISEGVARCKVKIL